MLGLENVEFQRMHFSIAMTYSRELVSVSRKIGSATRRLTALNRAGLVARALGDHAQAKKWYEEAVTIHSGKGKAYPSELVDLLEIAVSQKDEGLIAEYYEPVKRYYSQKLPAYEFAYVLRVLLDSSFVLRKIDDHAKFTEEYVIVLKKYPSWGNWDFAYQNLALSAFLMKKYDRTNSYIAEAKNYHKRLGTKCSWCDQFETLIPMK